MHDRYRAAFWRHGTARAGMVATRRGKLGAAMTVYFTSDHHFGHSGARSLYRRPFASVPEMDRQMIDRWNLAVKPEDEIWHLGDFAVRQSAEHVASLLRELHGRKHLVVGNNDDAAVTGCDAWESVQTYAELTVEGMSLVLCHYPFRTWRNMGKGAINLHGHSHGRLKPQPRQFDVGVDVWSFQPVRLADVVGRRKSRPREVRIADQRSH
jgi:calcineurin-like phosphoesterase family protein